MSAAQLTMKGTHCTDHSTPPQGYQNALRIGENSIRVLGMKQHNYSVLKLFKDPKISIKYVIVSKHGLTYVTLVLETLEKCDKLQCKPTFNRKWVCLLMIEHIEANHIVLYLPGDI